jgi:hypothetical protein
MKKIFFLICIGLLINTVSYAKNTLHRRVTIFGEYLCQKMTNYNNKGQVTGITYVYCDSKTNKSVRTKYVIK